MKNYDSLLKKRAEVLERLASLMKAYSRLEPATNEAFALRAEIVAERLMLTKVQEEFLKLAKTIILL